MSNQSPNALHLLIEPSAVVPLSAVFSVQGLNVDVDKPKIKLTIARGNVFHPDSHIILDVSSLSSSSSSSSTTLDTIEFRIGEYNLFEECSIVTFHLHESSAPFLLMGSYNLVAARCRLETSSVGNGNIFQASCHIQIPTIKNGNIFSPLCSLSFKDEQPHNIQEMVFYAAMGVKSNLICKFREHRYGTKKNIAQVGLLLSTVKGIIQTHHPLMRATMSNQR